MNVARVARQVRQYRGRALLIDANLLILYFVGARRPDMVRSYKRTSRYTVQDFRVLESFISGFTRLTTTPHVLTEVSNLLGDTYEPLCSELRMWMADVISHWTETSTASRVLMQAGHFPRYGLTDTAIADLGRGSCLVLTDDFALAGLLKTKHIEVLRFGELRKICL